MKLSILRYAICVALAAAVAACGGGGSDLSSMSSSGATTQSANMPLVISDASSDDWALVGVRVLSIALVPQGGSDNVTVFTAPSSAPYLNLEQLDNIGEILGNVSVPVGTYTGAVVTVGGNAGDVLLTAAADPEAGFAGAAGSSIAPADIQIQRTSGSGSNLTVPIDVNFDTPLVVSSSSTPNPALDLEFDLSHPAFIVGHQPPGCRHHRVGGQFRRPGAPPSDCRHHTPRAAPHVWQRGIGVERQHLDHDHQGIPDCCRWQTPETAVAARNS